METCMRDPKKVALKLPPAPRELNIATFVTGALPGILPLQNAEYWL